MMNYNPTQAKLFFLWELFKSAEDVLMSSGKC